MPTCKVPSKFQLRRPHLPASGGACGCVRLCTKPQIPLSGFVWFVKEEGSPSEVLKMSTEGQGEGPQAARMASVHRTEDTQEPKIKQRLNDTEHPHISRGKLIRFTHLEKGNV